MEENYQQRGEQDKLKNCI